MKPAFAASIVAASALGLLALERSVSACGGCFAPPQAFTAVDSHRMVIRLGAEETVLWDQFLYSGAPEEFAWVLPVPTADAVVELAESEFVQTVDEETAPIVQPASPPPCAAANGAGGCGYSPVGGVGVSPLDAVEVHERKVVGPYQTATISSEDPNALFNWLSVNGYAFPPEAVPTLEFYADKESAFVVLRLRPGEDVSAMQPVRVRFKGFMGSFPLRMVTVGASGAIELSLWVIAEQRYAPQNYPAVTIDEREITWDWESSESDYDEVFEAVIDRSGGRAWVTEYAAALPESELGDLLGERAAEDYAVATARLHYPYLTRLRTRILVDHLDEDLQLAPAEEPGDVSRVLRAGRDENYKCPDPAAGATLDAGGPGAARRMALLFAALLGAALVLRPPRNKNPVAT